MNPHTKRTHTSYLGTKGASVRYGVGVKIIFAKNIGFCFGVKRAIFIVENSLKNSKEGKTSDPKPVQCLEKLVHNERVIENLTKKGVKFIEQPEKISSGTLIIGAHGIPPSISERLKRKNLVIKDATCPLVKKAQRAAQSLFKEGYKVIIIGDRNHREINGIKGYTKNKATVVENELQAKNLPRFKKIGVISQTTQSLDKVNRILKILKTKARELKWLNTLCPEVLSRQKEVSEIIKKVKGILVIGSQTSANTKRLVEIARKSKKPVWWINSLEELKKEEFKNLPSLGVISGTSTPDWLIEKIINKLTDTKILNSSLQFF